MNKSYKRSKEEQDLSQKIREQEFFGEFETGRVWFAGKELMPERSQKIFNHSPDGFMWGYGGSGPSQLALAVLLEVTEEWIAKALYQAFKWDIIAKIPKRDFFMPDGVNVVKNWVKTTIERKENGKSVL